jgi:hypothetical protein
MMSRFNARRGNRRRDARHQTAHAVGDDDRRVARRGDRGSESGAERIDAEPPVVGVESRVEAFDRQLQFELRV